MGLAKQIVASAGIELGKFDAVLAHFGPIGVRAMAMREAGVFRGPLGTVFHGFDMSMTSVVQSNLPKYRELFDLGEMMFPISRAWQNQLIFWGCPPNKTEVMRMGVDLDKLGGNHIQPARFVGPLRVVTVGRLVEKKGTADAINAIRRSGFDVQLRVIGSGPLEHELRALADDTNKVVFMGAMDHAATLREVAAADVFLLPSVTASDGDKEGIPVSLMEAMALGTLVVATQHSGNAELIDHGISGWLVPERRPNDIVAVLHSIYRDDLDLDAIRTAARTKIADEFDNAKLDSDLVQALARLANPHMTP
jgi:colanic acid/amylovoran biosynthesis glycosyltransferase